MNPATSETIYISECCNASVTPETDYDYSKRDTSKADTLVMNVRMICNKCGQHCTIKELAISPGNSILTEEIITQYERV